MVHELVCNEWLLRIIVHEVVDGMTVMALDCNGFLTSQEQQVDLASLPSHVFLFGMHFMFSNLCHAEFGQVPRRHESPITKWGGGVSGLASVSGWRTSALEHW
jgi:hypothetical protein